MSLGYSRSGVEGEDLGALCGEGFGEFVVSFGGSRELVAGVVEGRIVCAGL